MLPRLIIWGIIVAVVYRAAKSWFKNSTTGRAPMTGSNVGQVDDVMIKDPVCGAFFPMRKGVMLHHDGKTLYFCGLDCQRRFLDEKRTRQ